MPFSKSGSLRGIALIVLGMGVLTLNDALMRILVSGLPLGQAVAMRGLTGCLVMLAVSPLAGGLSVLRPRSIRNVTILSTLMLIMLFLFPWSLQRLTLADGIMLVSSSPVFAALLAPWVVGESIGWWRWSAIFVGLIGTGLVIDPGPSMRLGGLSALLVLAALLAVLRLCRGWSQPGTMVLSAAILGVALWELSGTLPTTLRLLHGTGWEGMNIAVPVVLICAVLVALRDLLTQNFIVGESVLAVVFMANIFAAVGGGATLIYWAEAPSFAQLRLALYTGALVSLALWLSTQAFRYTGAVAISCLKYSGILWAILFGWWMFSESISSQALAGAALITLSGVIIAVREGQRE